MNPTQSSLSEIGVKTIPARNKQLSREIMKPLQASALLPTIEAQGLTSLPKNTTLGMISVNARKAVNKAAGKDKNVQLLCVRTNKGLNNRMEKLTIVYRSAE